MVTDIETTFSSEEIMLARDLYQIIQNNNGFGKLQRTHRIRYLKAARYALRYEKLVQTITKLHEEGILS